MAQPVLEKQLRDPERVMAPESMGAVRLTRYSFSRMLLRRAAADGWTCKRTIFDVDAAGRGEAVYEVNAGDTRLSFVAFLTTIDEALHTDRVVGTNWEIAAALVDGRPDADQLETLRREVPRQEKGRLDPRVLVLTRGNRSVRFFDYLVETLASGLQPDPDVVGDSGYIMRSTAFYGNGKFGMASFEGFDESHALGVPYRAQMLAAWLFREMSFDVVEQCAHLLQPATAVGFDDQWRRFFGLGNATGLGMVPFAFRHPKMINAWAQVRERALADVRSTETTPELSNELDSWIQRARSHLQTGTTEPCDPFLNPQELLPLVEEIATAWAGVRDHDAPFDALYLWAAAHRAGSELEEFVISLLIELHRADDDTIDASLLVDEAPRFEPGSTVMQLRSEIETNFGWIDEVGADRDDADDFWWVTSDNNEEPRRTHRSAIDPEARELPIDVALRLRQLRDALADFADDATAAEVIGRHPEHRFAIERIQLGTLPYGEPHDNACAGGYLPLMLQRFQLAMYGMDNFKPKSTDWLRVTLYQGAPRLSDLAAGGDAMADTWAMPPRPVAMESTR